MKKIENPPLDHVTAHVYQYTYWYVLAIVAVYVDASVAFACNLCGAFFLHTREKSHPLLVNATGTMACMHNIIHKFEANGHG